MSLRSILISIIALMQEPVGNDPIDGQVILKEK